jgi:hypothetical protein
MGFETKDSGERLVFDSGMQRDVTEGKIDYLLVRDGPMFERWAALLQRGADKYDARNWMKARGEAELYRFRESAARHFEQWLRGEEDEDHAAAVIFNINGAEYVQERLWADDDDPPSPFIGGLYYDKPGESGLCCGRDGCGGCA